MLNELPQNQDDKILDLAKKFLEIAKNKLQYTTATDISVDEKSKIIMNQMLNLDTDESNETLFIEQMNQDFKDISLYKILSMIKITLNESDASIVNQAFAQYCSEAELPITSNTNYNSQYSHSSNTPETLTKKLYEELLCSFVNALYYMNNSNIKNDQYAYAYFLQSTFSFLSTKDIANLYNKVINNFQQDDSKVLNHIRSINRVHSENNKTMNRIFSEPKNFKYLLHAARLIAGSEEKSLMNHQEFLQHITKSLEKKFFNSDCDKFATKNVLLLQHQNIIERLISIDKEYDKKQERLIEQNILENPYKKPELPNENKKIFWELAKIMLNTGLNVIKFIAKTCFACIKYLLKNTSQNQTITNNNKHSQIPERNVAPDVVQNLQSHQWDKSKENSYADSITKRREVSDNNTHTRQ